MSAPNSPFAHDPPGSRSSSREEHASVNIRSVMRSQSGKFFALPPGASAWPSENTGRLNSLQLAHFKPCSRVADGST